LLLPTAFAYHFSNEKHIGLESVRDWACNI
jgi:hypothetical protein